MKKIVLFTAFSAVILSSGLSQAATVPCEDSLAQLRTLEGSSKPTEAIKAEVAKLETKGIERCNADDDKRADDFFAQATKLLTK